MRAYVGDGFPNARALKCRYYIFAVRALYYVLLSTVLTESFIRMCQKNAIYNAINNDNI